MDKSLEAINALREQTRFYISSPERAAEALLFVRNLETFAEEVKAKVKERSVEVMDRDGVDVIPYSITDPTTGEVREWELRRTYSSIMKEYRPENVLEAIGVERAIKFFKVSKTKLDTYLKKASAKKEISMDQLAQAIADPIEKVRKSSGVMLKEIKAKI